MLKIYKEQPHDTKDVSSRNTARVLREGHLEITVHLEPTIKLQAA